MENTNSNLTSKLLTVSELARLLQLSSATIYRLTKSGQLSYYRLRGSLRFEKNDIDTFLLKKYRGSNED